MSRRTGLGLVGLVIATVGLTSLAGFRSTAAPEPLAAAAATEAAPPAGGVVAAIGDTQVTRDELEAHLRAELLQLEQQRHQLLEQGLDGLIADRLLELEAAAEGTGAAELVTRKAEAIQPVTDAEIDAFYEANQAQIGQPKDQIAGRIRQFLEQQRREEARGRYLEELKVKYGVQSFIEPFRFEVEAAGSPSKGPADAPVTIVEFSDFECPFCSRLAPTLDRVSEVYADRVRLVFRQFPLSNIHPNAQKAAEAALCAHEQGKFWEMHDTLFREQRALGVEQLKQKAARLELDEGAFNECLDGGRFADQVGEDLAAGSELGVTGTPAIFINGRVLNGAQPFEEIARIIDDELERAGG